MHASFVLFFVRVRECVCRHVSLYTVCLRVCVCVCERERERERERCIYVLLNL